MIAIDWGGVATGVVTAAIVGGGGLLWVLFTTSGRDLWNGLGTFTLRMPAPGSAEQALTSSSTQIVQIKGVRIVAAVAAAALILALGALTAFFLRPTSGGQALGKISIVPVRFGQGGSSENGKDEGARFVQLNPLATQRFARVADFPICTISDIAEAAPGNCALSQSGGEWQVYVTGNFSCKATCFKVAVTQ